jgi:large subunit ribosomal protein L12e
MAKSFAGTVKQVLGTCLSIGCTVDKQSPKDLIAKITNG